MEAWELKQESDLETFHASSEVAAAGKEGYAKSLESILNEGEDENSLRQYKVQARKLLNLPEFALKPDIVI